MLERDGWVGQSRHLGTWFPEHLVAFFPSTWLLNWTGVSLLLDEAWTGVSLLLEEAGISIVLLVVVLKYAYGKFVFVFFVGRR